MIYAGTIASYLTIESSEFNRGIGEALRLLADLCASGVRSQGALGMLGSAAGSTAAYLTGSLVSALFGAVTGLSGTASATGETAEKMRTKMAWAVLGMQGSLSALGGAASVAGGHTRQIAAAVEAQLTKLKGSAYSIMSNVGSSLNAGLASKRSAIVSTAAGIADSVTRTIKSALKIASPSKVMRRLGEQTAQGFAVGLDDIRPDVSRRAGLIADAVTGADYSAGAVRGTNVGDLSALAERLDALISVLADGGQTMQVDGRAFARLIREYS